MWCIKEVIAMSKEQMKELELESETQAELCDKIIHAAGIVNAIYGELIFNDVVEEVLESERAKYSADEIQRYLYKMVNLNIIPLFEM